MKLRSVILIALILIVPLVALTWAVMRIADNEQVAIEQRFRELLEERLQDVNGNIEIFFASAERDLNKITALDDYDIAELRRVNRSEPRLMQLFVLDANGNLTYPDVTESEVPMNSVERRFVEEAAKMFGGQDLHEFVLRSEHTKTESSQVQTRDNEIRSFNRREASPMSASSTAGSSGSTSTSGTTSGWFVWYWDRGVNLIYWQRRPSGHIVGCALERARWIADLIAALPDTVAERGKLASGIETRVRLANAAGESVYQWGTFEPSDDSIAFCEVPVTAPLAAWRLQCFVPEDELTAGTGNSAWFGLLAVLTAVAALLAICGFFFVREYARDMREAAQQVSFVNQVSHELRTPLTNIRMYAELLDRDLDEVEATDAAKPRERLAVILSEGQRLSRLIGNVLTFARQKRQTLQLQTRKEDPCKLISTIVDRFRPAFEQQKITVEIDCKGESSLEIDSDVLEQILGNLLSNVEKYAASGSRLKVESNIDGDMLSIGVRDFGPGIEKSKREMVFEPFARISNDVSHVAGTGIGLPIARELARLHGGDLQLLDCTDGCWFRATIRSTGGRKYK